MQAIENQTVIAPADNTEDVKYNTVEKKLGDSNDTNAVDKKELDELELNVGKFLSERQDAGASLPSSIINMMNTIIGAGVLSIPNTVKRSGLVGSFLLLAVSLYLSLEGANMLALSSTYTKEDSYGAIAGKLVGKAVGVLSDITMIVFDFGVSIAYFMILFQQIIDLLHSWGKIAVETLAQYRTLISSVVTLVICFPLLCIPSIDSLRFVSALSVICIVLFVIIAAIKGISTLIKNPLEYSIFPESFSGLSSAVSVFFTSMCCHVNIPKMTQELKLPETSRYNTKIAKMARVNMTAFLCCGTVYFVVGACGYLAYGNAIGDNLLTNFSADNAWYLNIVKLAYAFVVLCSYPALSFAALVTFDKMVFKQPRPTYRRVLEAFVWSMLALFCAIVLPGLEKVFGITGSTCGILLVFVWPALFFVHVAKRERAKSKTSQIPLIKVSNGKYYFAWFLFYIGLFACILFTTIQLKDTIQGK